MRTLSIIVPALNEERRLELTVNEMLGLARSSLDAFEIIIVNDGSQDGTGLIADSLALGNPEVEVIHHSSCQGLGVVFSECIPRARCDNLMLIPGDHAYNTESLAPILQAIGTADVLIGRRTNQTGTRSSLRVFLSRSYNAIMALLFGFKLDDFHGLIIYPLPTLRKIDLRLIGYTFQIEALIKLLRRGHTFLEVPVRLNQEAIGTSRSLRLKTLADVLRIVFHLLWTK
jgi:dolichol-phosphate mannosyltransferase